jgi:hypothetical protein
VLPVCNAAPNYRVCNVLRTMLDQLACELQHGHALVACTALELPRTPGLVVRSNTTYEIAAKWDLDH